MPMFFPIELTYTHYKMNIIFKFQLLYTNTVILITLYLLKLLGNIICLDTRHCIDILFHRMAFKILLVVKYHSKTCFQNMFKNQYTYIGNMMIKYCFLNNLYIYVCYVSYEVIPLFIYYIRKGFVLYNKVLVYICVINSMHEVMLHTYVIMTYILYSKVSLDFRLYKYVYCQLIFTGIQLYEQKWITTF